MKIGIIGTRGIPNHYGGFEQFAEYLSVGLVEMGHEVSVYCPHHHPEKSEIWNGVHRIMVNDPEEKWGTVGQFIYDLNGIWDARKRNFDVILQLGYTSSSIWGPLMPSAKIFTNMDGLEWKRSKFSKPVQTFLKFAERMAIWYSDEWISDSIGIQEYLKKKYNKDSTYIAYGAWPFNTPDSSVLQKYQVQENHYFMLVARMEPENNVEVILDGYVKSGSSTPFLVVGKTENAFGTYLVEKYKNQKGIRFQGGIYNLNDLNQLRYHCKAYFHGHSVGGTNPSLLEAMASQAAIMAHNNIFNQSILGDDAWYFNQDQDVAEIIMKTEDPSFDTRKANVIQSNYSKIVEDFSWDKIIHQYEKLLTK